MFMSTLLLSASLALQSAPLPAPPVATEAAPMTVFAPSASAVAPPEPSQVMAIPDELRNAFETRVLDATHSPEQRLRQMIAFMFDKDGLGLRYRADTTNTIAESYRTREVNCLSFTLMAVALSREAGLKAQGQQINRVMAWSLIGDVVTQNLHANTVVTIKDRNLMMKDGRDFVLDIASRDLNGQEYLVTDYKVDDQHLLASFYGNRAMELLAAGRMADAQAWLDVALKLSPYDSIIWNNVGVLRLRTGDTAGAEEWFLRAAKQNPRLTSALYNLVALYHARGDSKNAVIWQERADRILRRDPYYQYSLGERHAQSGNYDDALRYYRRAISLHRDEPLFHFGLAQTYFQLGQSRRAGSELALARDLGGEKDHSRYQAKLDVLKRMRQ